jgi:hypothetical protein
MFIIAGIFDRLFKKKKEPYEEVGGQELERYPEYAGEEEYMQMQGEQSPEFYNEPSELDMVTRIHYDYKTPEFRLKVQNTSIDMLGDLSVNLKSQRNSVVTPIDSEKVLEMLEPGKSGIIKFRLKPKFKAGKSSIFGKVEYFDFKSKERKVVRLPPAHVDFEMQKISGKKVTEDQWRITCGGLKSFDIETDALEIQPAKLFNIFRRVLENLGLFLLPPIENVNLYRGIAKFYGESKSGAIFTIEVQVIGDKKNSKVLYRIWSDEPRDAMALAYKSLDVIDGIIKIKKFIVET